MKLFIRHIAAFSALILVLLLLGEFFVRSLPNPYQFKYEWMSQHAKETELLILGTSQSEMGIMPQLMDKKGFNLGMPHGTLEYDWYLLEKFQPNYQHLHHVIIELSYYNLFAIPFEDNPDSKYRAIYYSIYMDYPKHQWSPMYNFEMAHPEFFRSHIANGFEAIVKHLPYPDQCDSLGCVIMDGTMANDKERLCDDADHVIASFNKAGYDYLDLNLSYLNQILDFCHHQGISTTIVVLPMTQELLQRMDKKKVELFNAVLRNYEKKGIPVADYLNDDRFSTPDFVNSNHLNRKGAVKLTNLLKEHFD